jgi:hypothetical protein
MPGKMPTTEGRAFAGVKAQAEKAARRGPNPDDLTQGRMKIPGPARFIGTVSASKGPIQPGDQHGPKTFHVPAKPVSTQKGQPAKEVG